MRIVSFNVNSVRSRLTLVIEWLKENPMDVVLFQELKCVDDDFPKVPFYDLGYNITTFGQKTYNGVAILSKKPIEDIQRGIPGFEDEQSRYIEAVIGTKRIISVYVPNGSEVGSDKFQYKLDFLAALKNHLKSILSYQEEVIIGGDFNIAPSDIDVHNPDAWEDSILCSKAERLKFFEILNLGYSDAYRALYPEKNEYTWWDYRAGSFEKDQGLRIDHFLLSPEAMDTVKSIWIDKTTRALEKPSDHAPIIVEF